MANLTIVLSASMGNINKPGTPAASVKYIYDTMATFFNLNVTYADKRVPGDITYRFQKWDYSDGEAIPGAVTMRARAGRAFRIGSLENAILMHETMHAISWGQEDYYSPKLTVMGGARKGPFLRLDDYRKFETKWELRAKSGDVVYSWNANSGDSLLNGKFLRNFYHRYIYDIVGGATTDGRQTLNFQNFNTAVVSDLRASGTIQAGSDAGKVDPKRIFGTRLQSSNFFGLNIFNASSAVLHDLTTGGASDRLTGNELANRLEGNGGNDTLRGLAGADTLDGGSGINTADYLIDASEGGKQGVVVNLSGVAWGNLGPRQARDGFGSIDELIAIQNVIGSRYDDLMIGSDDDNEFDGYAGNDTFKGGGGIDTVNYSRDSLRKAKSGVSVDLRTGTAIDSFGNIDTLESIENVIGNGYNDSITGDDGSNVLLGVGGNDILDGGAGNDTLGGGSGTDVFVFGLSYGADLVTDFDAKGRRWHDVLKISLALSSSYADLMSKATQMAPNLVFDFGNGNTLTLSNVIKQDFTRDNVVFFQP